MPGLIIMILTHLSATPELVSIYKTELQPNQLDRI